MTVGSFLPCMCCQSLLDPQQCPSAGPWGSLCAHLFFPALSALQPLATRVSPSSQFHLRESTGVLLGFLLLHHV